MSSPSAVAAATRLIVTCTASREPLLLVTDIEPGTHISAVGADSPGKQELDPDILRDASLLLVDSLAQCEQLGELAARARISARGPLKLENSLNSLTPPKARLPI